MPWGRRVRGLCLNAPYRHGEDLQSMRSSYQRSMSECVK